MIDNTLRIGVSIGVEIWLWRRLGADRQPLSRWLCYSSAQKVDLPAAIHLALGAPEPSVQIADARRC